MHLARENGRKEKNFSIAKVGKNTLEKARTSRLIELLCAGVPAKSCREEIAPISSSAEGGEHLST
ncbi:MAG: hypothetical protein ACLQL2_03360 [Methylovirgula sp.]